MNDKLENGCSYKVRSLGEQHCFTTPRYIEDISQFEKLLNVCEEAHEDEVIVLNVFCYGGCLNTTKTVYNALRMTNATVYTVNKSVAASGGSVLLLAGDSIGIEPYAYTMIHTATYGHYPDKAPEIKASTDFHDRDIRTFYEEVYKGFLTDEELTDVLKGSPIYIHDLSEHKERLERMFEYRKSIEEEFYEEQSQGLPTKEDLLKKTKKELVAMMVGEDDEGDSE